MSAPISPTIMATSTMVCRRVGRFSISAESWAISSFVESSSRAKSSLVASSCRAEIFLHGEMRDLAIDLIDPGR